MNVTFKDLGLADDLLQGIEALGFTTPTPIQSLVIPAALTSPTDLIALAQTGTGKTAAFGLPMIQLIKADKKGIQGLILCPTRELCVQVASDLVNYSKFRHEYKVTAVYGGASIDTQIRQIKQGTQIVVATPGRLIDLMSRGVIKLENISRIVLDEADEMLNMGFKDAIDEILAAATGERTVWLFSATMPSEVRQIAKNYMVDAQEVTAGNRNEGNANIEHQYYVCHPDNRFATLKRIVDHNPGIFGLVFCRTKNDTKEIAEEMIKDGYNAEALHGDLSQSDRDRVMNRFRERNLQLLIATDVAARGIDVSDVSHVINYGLPDDIEVYTHRSGRTGRAGKQGVSVTILTPKFEFRVKEIERMTKAKFTKMVIPSGEEVCERQLMHIIKNIHDIEVQEDEIASYMPQIFEELQDLSKEELIKRIASVEFNRFLSYYKDAYDLNIRPRNAFGSDRRDSNGSSGKPFKSSGKYRRIFANIGEMDGVDKSDFTKVVTKNFSVPVSALGQIDIKKAYMHFDIENQYADSVMEGLRKMSVNNRSVRVDEASERKSFGGEKPAFKKKAKFGKSY